jgi:acetamidase/formamidase
VVRSGLNNPRHLTETWDGLYVAVAFGHGQSAVVRQDVLVNSHGVTGLPKPAGDLFGKLLIRWGHQVTTVDLAAYAAAHPQSSESLGTVPGETAFDSDPYDVVAYHGGFVVADAAANSLLQVSPSGHTHLLAPPTTPGALVRISSNGKHVTTLPVSGLFQPTGVALGSPFGISGPGAAGPGGVRRADSPWRDPRPGTERTAMTTHRLDPTPETTRDVFSRDHRPVLAIDPGDTVTVRSLDASGFLARQTYPGQDQPRLIAQARGHCLTGPIEVRGAQPGGMLALSLTGLRPDTWGWTAAGGRDTPVARRLGVAGGPPSWLLWELDPDAGQGRAGAGITRTLGPFLGVMGTAPAEPGEHSTIPPRPANGGNIDCRELVAGSTLFLPVAVPGALLYLGDGHAAQGDGEVGGTAIECGMTTAAVVGLAAGRPVATIHAETPAGRITFGFDADLNVAMGDALDAMVTWLQTLSGLDRAAALALASTCVDMRITQVANQTWGVHAVLPGEL